MLGLREDKGRGGPLQILTSDLDAELYFLPDTGEVVVEPWVRVWAVIYYSHRTLETRLRVGPSGVV